MASRQMTVQEAMGWLEANKNWLDYQKLCLDFWKENAPEIYPTVLAKFEGMKK